MIRYLAEVGIGEELHTHTGKEFPSDVAKFLRENVADLVGKVNSDRNLKPNEIINVDNVNYLHVGSRKYYKTKSDKAWIPVICELSFVQKVLYRKKNDENVK